MALPQPNYLEQMNPLLADLADARESAKRDRFDLPTPKAYERAVSLLKRITASHCPTECVDTAVGDDGSIEITAVVNGEYVIVNINPNGSRLGMIVQGTESRAKLVNSPEATEEEVIDRLERATGT